MFNFLTYQSLGSSLPAHTYADQEDVKVVERFASDVSNGLNLKRTPRKDCINLPENDKKFLVARIPEILRMNAKKCRRSLINVINNVWLTKCSYKNEEEISKIYNEVYDKLCFSLKNTDGHRINFEAYFSRDEKIIVDEFFDPHSILYIKNPVYLRNVESNAGCFISGYTYRKRFFSHLFHGHRLEFVRCLINKA